MSAKHIIALHERQDRTSYRMAMVRKDFYFPEQTGQSPRRWRHWKFQCDQLKTWLELIEKDKCVTGKAGERLDNIIAALNNTNSDYARRFKKLLAETLETFKLYESTR